MNRKKCHSTMQLKRNKKKTTTTRRTHGKKRNSKPFFSHSEYSSLGNFVVHLSSHICKGFFSFILPTFQRCCWQIEWTTNIIKQMTKRMLKIEDKTTKWTEIHTMKGRRAMATNSRAQSKHSHWIKRKNKERKLNNKRKNNCRQHCSMKQRITRRKNTNHILKIPNNTKYAFLCNDRRKQRQRLCVSADERCTFQLKLITITYQSLIFLRCRCTCMCGSVVYAMPCLEALTIEMHRLWFGLVVHLLFDNAKTFLCDRWGKCEYMPHSMWFAEGEERFFLWWSWFREQNLCFWLKPLFALLTTEYLLNSFSQRIVKPFTRILFEIYSFQHGLIVWFCVLPPRQCS